MKIKQVKVRKIEITDILQSKGLDPISVYLEDFEPRKGKITISCWDKSWHSYWGGMGDRTISEFFLSCDNHYLAKNLSSIPASINDYKALGEKIKEFYKDEYEEQDNFDTWELYQTIDSLSEESVEWDAWLRNDGHAVMSDVFGEEWWYDIPTMPNPRYKYLCRIIDVVKEALKTDKR